MRPLVVAKFCINDTMNLSKVAVDVHTDAPIVEVTIYLDNLILNITGCRWSMYDTLIPRLTPEEAEDDDMRPQPPWGLLLSNGEDQLYLHENVRKPFLSLRSLGGSSGVELVLSVDAAVAIHAAITTKLDDGTIFRKSPAKRVCIRPQGIFYKYDARMITVSPAAFA